MKLEEVLPALRAGKRIRVRDWNDLSYIQESHWVYDIRYRDFISDDWEVIEEPKCELCNGDKILYVTNYHIESNKQYGKYMSDSKGRIIINCSECCKCLT